MAAAGDLLHMRRALALAEGQLGRTWPNPSVGCVLVKGGVVIGEGVTGDGGRPHAEEIALAAAGAAAQGAAAYVSLEPCAKRSSASLSCTDRLIAAGVAQVFAAIEDPHPNAAGDGIARLRAAGLAVELGACAVDAAALNAGFISRVVHKMPTVTADARRDRYDAAFTPPAGEDFRKHLQRLATAGLTRLCVSPDSALAQALEREGLLTPPYVASP